MSDLETFGIFFVLTVCIAGSLVAAITLLLSVHRDEDVVGTYLGGKPEHRERLDDSKLKMGAKR